MPVFRVERNKGYTVMSNHHLRNKDLTLKAKGLLSQMLSLPEDWDYTLKGLALINREKIDAIRQAIRELEQAGYIVRSRERDDCHAPLLSCAILSLGSCKHYSGSCTGGCKTQRWDGWLKKFCYNVYRLSVCCPYLSA